MPSAVQAVSTLQDLFPHLPRSLLEDVLAQHGGDLEHSIDSLLVLADTATPTPSQAISRPPPAQQAKPRRASPRSSRPPHGAAPTWGSMGLSADLQARLQVSPSYLQAPAYSPNLGLDDDHPPATIPSMPGRALAGFPLLAPTSPTPQKLEGGQRAHTYAPSASPSETCSNMELQAGASRPPVPLLGGHERPLPPCQQPISSPPALQVQMQGAAPPSHQRPSQKRAQQHWLGTGNMQNSLDAVPAVHGDAHPPTQQHSPGFSAGGRGEAGVAAGRSLWKEEAALQLLQVHPWIDLELVDVVLSAVQFDLGSAQELLADMAREAQVPGSITSGGGSVAASSAKHPTRVGGRGGGLDAKNSAASSSSGSEGGRGLGSCDCLLDDCQEEESWWEEGGGEVEEGDFVVRGPSQCRGTARQAAAGSARAGSVVVNPSRPCAPRHTLPSATEPTLRDLRSTEPAPEGLADDVYWRHRAEALRKTRQWQKAVKKAAAAYSSGRKAAASTLAAEAQRLRQESLAAHEEAAARIEEELNAGGSLWELDLHGLHMSEAVAALERRLQLVQRVLREAALQPPKSSAEGVVPPQLCNSTSGGPTAQAKFRCGACQGEASNQARLESGGCGTGVGALSVAPATVRRELRVIVGRGAHSSGGEATLPRAVEARLTALGYSFTRRTGALDVQLKRPFGSNSSVTSKHIGHSTSSSNLQLTARGV